MDQPSRSIFFIPSVSMIFMFQELIKAVLQEEDIYTIESLVAKKGSKYLVKWENFPSDQNTWEPRSAIPPFIVKVSDDFKF